ncbi:hypothetical protein [Marinobacterium rhizophilum]|uniref:hypothetical protein n=1 Tax=Marinobacterium rhizophilum TaxID=420402 RepID=UPI0030840C03
MGPTLGGYLTEYYSWRWVFYINLPFGILAWLGLLCFSTNPRSIASVTLIYWDLPFSVSPSPRCRWPSTAVNCLAGLTRPKSCLSSRWQRCAATC